MLILYMPEPKQCNPKSPPSFQPAGLFHRHSFLGGGINSKLSLIGIQDWQLPTAGYPRTEGSKCNN